MKFSLSKLPVALTATALLTMGLHGCIRTSGVHGGGGLGTGSLLTAIKGIDDKDKAREGVSYKLLCDSGTQAEGTPTQVRGEDFVVFKDAKVSDGDTCAMHVRVDAKDLTGMEWLGKNNGQPDVGLLYGSDKGKVANNQLLLTLYKTYNELSPNDATLQIRLAYDESVPAANHAPAASTANLACGEENFAGQLQKLPEDSAAEHVTAVFRVDTTKINGLVCEKVLISSNKDNQTKFDLAAETENLKIENLAKGAVTSLPTDTAKRFTIKAHSGSGLNVGTEAGECLTGYDSANNKCLDKRVVQLPANGYVLAVVDGYDVDKTKVRYTIATKDPASNKLTTVTKNTLTIDDINTGIEASSIKAWRYDMSMDLVNTTFDNSFVNGNAYAGSQINQADLLGTKILHIHKVYVHGFAPVSESTLNARRNIRYYTYVKASKAGSPDVEFLAGGEEDYFYAQGPEAGLESSPRYFTVENFIQDMQPSAPAPRWQAYAIKGKSFAPSGCQLDGAYYQVALSAVVPQQLTPGGSEASKLNACKIAPADFNVDLTASWQVQTVPMLYGWHLVN